MRPLLLFAGVLMSVVAGCKPAERYSVRGTPDEKKTAAPGGEAIAEPPLSAAFSWIDPQGMAPPSVERLVFVHEKTDPIEWSRLDRFWTVSTTPEKAAGTVGAALSSPLIGPIIAGPDPLIVKIKVPRGLDDPAPFIPAANPPTLKKWELGRKLFFDTSWLSSKGNVSCAGCHLPEQGFTDGPSFPTHDGFNTPTLVNVVYNTAQFWDGRATYLEEVVARKLEDERQKDGPFNHTWGGVIGRLNRPDSPFIRPFNEAFGTLPNQDSVGKALATYLRTLLAGNSIHDRAMAQSKAGFLEAADYEKVLDAAALKWLGAADRPARDVAAELLQGWKLFTDRIPERKLRCAVCHSGGQFTDSQFHNVGLLRDEDFGDSRLPGHIAHVPIGLRQRGMQGAYKTPTLRGLLRSPPYFHTGAKADLKDALILHTQGFDYNSCLDPLLREGDAWNSARRIVTLTPMELDALTLFLKALNSEEVDAAVRKPPG